MKYKEGSLLKQHILQSHLEFEQGKGKLEDPLGDPLAWLATEPESWSGAEGGETGTDCEKIEMKDIEVIKANGEINTNRVKHESNTPELSPIKPSQMSDSQKVLNQFSGKFSFEMSSLDSPGPRDALET